MTELERYTFKDRTRDRLTLVLNSIRRIIRPLPEKVWVHDGMLSTYFRSTTAREADRRLSSYQFSKNMDPYYQKMETEEYSYFLGPCGQHD